ncbi:hypothetical protein [Notoacmeibacter ruber]|nr:hypothetical protein [Notoacmeibacter ruber]
MMRFFQALIAFPLATGLATLALQTATAAPKIIHIDQKGNVEEHYVGDGDPRVLAGKRATADRQDNGLPVIVRGPGRAAPTSNEPAIVVRQFLTHPHYRAPIAPTLTRPLVRRPVVVRPQIVRAKDYADRRHYRPGPTVVFNGGHGRYDDVNIDIEQY